MNPKSIDPKPEPAPGSSCVDTEKICVDLTTCCVDTRTDMCQPEFSLSRQKMNVDGRLLYNVFLEYLPRGSVSELYRGEPMAEDNVRRYAVSMLQGLCRVHKEGSVHCDLKPQNVLIAGPRRTKIADFGLAKRVGAQGSGSGHAGFLRGTLLYMVLEFVEKSEYEPMSDVWSLGCVVSKMATGMSAWRYGERATTSATVLLLLYINFDEEFPEIPEELSEEGRDFLGRCFMRKPSERLTVEMLLGHPFMAAAAAAAAEVSKSDGKDDGHSKKGNQR
ncbi:hypothetical protein Taro_043047 [Colocasia esculenta]|uniref:Protein kinase domain-containing protein n=1 Tax=Colocasia esculenta TaxID=4460 RepID=A0A843WZV5_COLES|nr:hypothetical protein [Colocasia esculenta]